MPERRACSGHVQRPVRLAAVILPPSHFKGVAEQIAPADVVLLAHLSAAQAAEVALSLVCAGSVEAERHGVIDPAHLKAGVQRVPATRFVGVDDGARRDPLAQGSNRVGFLAEHERQGLTA